MKMNQKLVEKSTAQFEVHSNESACRKSGRLGLEQVKYITSDNVDLIKN